MTAFAFDPSLDVLSYKVRGCMFRVHAQLKAGLMEKVYEEALCVELKKENLQIEQQIGLPVSYDEIKLPLGYRADVVVEGKIVIEIKAVAELAPIHHAQIINYMKLGNYRLGFLVNFNCVSLVNKVSLFRIVN